MVADASLLVDALVGSDSRAEAARSRLMAEGDAHVPHLADLEVAGSLRRLRTQRRIDETQAVQALEDLGQMPLHRYPHQFLLPRIWELRDTVTPYDAVYVALAEVLDAPLVTADARLARAAGPRCRVDVLSA